MIPLKTLRTAETHLAAADPVMAQLITRFGPSSLGRKLRDPFHVLCASIIGQQVSAKAADTIQARIATHLGAPTDGFEHHHFAAATQESLRACGVSNAKAKWLLELAARQADGRFDSTALALLDDLALSTKLDALPGIGPWTAEMMLIFAFDRLDVFSLGDVGLRNTINKLYLPKDLDGKQQKLDDKETLKLTAQWAPYRSVACWYLWREIDGDVGTWT